MRGDYHVELHSLCLAQQQNLDCVCTVDLGSLSRPFCLLQRHGADREGHGGDWGLLC